MTAENIGSQNPAPSDGLDILDQHWGDDITSAAAGLAEHEAAFSRGESSGGLPEEYYESLGAVALEDRQFDEAEACRKAAEEQARYDRLAEELEAEGPENF